MKLRLIITLITAGCFNQIASATDLTSGNITGEVQTSTPVTFSEPTTVHETVRITSNLKAGGNSEVQIATSTVSLQNDTGNVGARLAYAVTDDSDQNFSVNADNHPDDDDYKLEYRIAPVLENQVDDFTANSKKWKVTKTNVTGTQYNVFAIPPKKGGTYHMLTYAAIYKP